MRWRRGGVRGHPPSSNHVCYRENHHRRLGAVCRKLCFNASAHPEAHQHEQLRKVCAGNRKKHRRRKPLALRARKVVANGA